MCLQGGMKGKKRLKGIPLYKLHFPLYKLHFKSKSHASWSTGSEYFHEYARDLIKNRTCPNYIIMQEKWFKGTTPVF